MVIVCPNKTDLYGQRKDYRNELEKEIGAIEWVAISAKEKENLDQLKQVLLEYIGSLKQELGNHIIVSQRHWQELKETKNALVIGKSQLQEGYSGDLVSFHLRAALQHLGNITGNIEVDKDILGTIFGKFCIGK